MVSAGILVSAGITRTPGANPADTIGGFIMIVLSTQNISKHFGVVRALDGVSIDLLAGQVHGIVGENGAGKSTLMKILSGVERPDSGQVMFRGQLVDLRNPLDAQRMGISMIHQELNLIDELSVADNIFLGREKTVAGFVDRSSTMTAATEILGSIRCDVPANAKVKSLSIAQKQMIEIAKAVSIKASVLIMDEPTAVLSGRETAALFDLVNRLRGDGVAVVYISHLLPEVLKICDQATVMRDGKIVETIQSERATKTPVLSCAEEPGRSAHDPALRRTSERASPTLEQIGERGLASRMVGRPLADHFPKREPAGEEIAIEVTGLNVPGKVKDVSFVVRRGEILGFAGLIGAGRTEMAEAVCGLRKKSSGHVSVSGKLVSIRNVRDAVRAGLAYLSEDRKATGLTLAMSIAQNTTLASLKQRWIRRSAETATTHRRVDELKIKVGNIHNPVSSLSGGNQQKVALAKWLETKPKVLFVDEPTRGVDIGAKEQIYQLIQSLTRAGMACILISSELNEVIGLSHRIAVMRNGQIAATLDAASATEESIMHYAAGVENSTGRVASATLSDSKEV
jgi:ribose transport system ATP-binding protein